MTTEINSIAQVHTLGDLLRFQAKQRGDADAFLFEDRRSTYKQFDERVTQVANGLLAAGLAKGGRVGFMAKNSDLFYEVVFGCAKAGAVSVGINWRLAPPEVAFILNDSQAEVLFIGAEFQNLIEQIQDDLTHIRQIICMSESHEKWPDYTTWRSVQSVEEPSIEVHPDDIATQMYTSGTTGHPKGVQLPHRCFFDLQNIPPNPDMDWNNWQPDDVSLVAMPSFHIGGIGYGVWGLRGGALNVIISEFEAGVVLEIIEREHITKTFIVPSAIGMCVQHPNAPNTDFSSMRSVMYGASPIPLDLLRDALNIFKCGFVQLYGMTETTGAATYLPPEDHDPNGNKRMLSAGKPYPGVKLKIVDSDNNSLPNGEVGEICIYSPANMTGYWNLPQATDSSLRDGYVYTGDAGYLDDDGYVFVHDRVKDMIVSGGENVYPAEVESAIFGHPAIADVAVIGVPDKTWGEAVKAIVVFKPGEHSSSDEIIAFTRSRVAAFKCPKSVDVVDELPRNPSGKVLKRELRKPYWEGMEKQVN
jgi:acyl-CoA synthetase (AMP-forming)/AMP-acid ligase II